MAALNPVALDLRSPGPGLVELWATVPSHDPLSTPPTRLVVRVQDLAGNRAIDALPGATQDRQLAFLTEVAREFDATRELVGDPLPADPARPTWHEVRLALPAGAPFGLSVGLELPDGVPFHPGLAVSTARLLMIRFWQPNA